MADIAIVVLAGAIVALLTYQVAKGAPQVPVAQPPQTPPGDVKSDYLEVLGARVAALETRVGELPAIYEEERKRAERHRARAEESERRTRQLLDEGEEDAWDEMDEGAQLRLEHGNGGLEEGVPTVPGNVGRTRAADVRARANRMMGL